MIASFRCKDTEALFAGNTPQRFRTIESAATRRLQALDSTTDPRDLRSPPGNRLESLKGDRAGQYSIRINDQWRICFRFEQGQAFDVEIIDYH